MAGDKLVTVSVTPSGRADAVHGTRFVLPAEEKMELSAFLDVMEDPAERRGVHYVQTQNSNLTSELGELLGDVEEPAWAREAFGEPDAINFWMGDERAVTSSEGLQ